MKVDRSYKRGDLVRLQGGITGRVKGVQRKTRNDDEMMVHVTMREGRLYGKTYLCSVYEIAKVAA